MNRRWPASRLDAFLIRGVQAAVADVLHDRACEKLDVLEDDAQGATQVRLADLVDVDAVVSDLAVGDVVEAVDQVRDRRLAGARRAHESDLLSGLRPQGDVVQDLLLAVIGEVHALHDKLAAQARVGDGAVGLVG